MQKLGPGVLGWIFGLRILLAGSSQRSIGKNPWHGIEKQQKNESVGESSALPWLMFSKLAMI
jgi:hypothetical protein